MKLYFAEEFSPYPYGKYEGDGENNGTKFRRLLAKRFQEAQAKGEPLEVILDDVHILHPSFLDVAFGTFAKELKEAENISLSENNLSFRGNFPDHKIYIRKTWEYINRHYSPEDKKHAA